MIVYFLMSKKKTREEKIKSSHKIAGQRLTYSYTGSKSSDAIVLTNKELDYHKKEIKIILIAASVIFTLNVFLYVFLSTGIITLGFLGY